MCKTYIPFSLAGRSLAGNIFENMAASRKVVAVLSRNYLNAMNMFELDIAVHEMYRRNIEEVLVVHINDGLPLQKLPKLLVTTMKRHHVIEWTNDENAKALFQQTLIDHLDVKRVAADLDAE